MRSWPRFAGTNRVAEAGAWLGGIVPYGYRKVGEKATARLVVSDEKIPGFVLSEVDVIQSIYRMAAVERKSCFGIADFLNKQAVINADPAILEIGVMLIGTPPATS